MQNFDLLFSEAQKLPTKTILTDDCKIGQARTALLTKNGQVITGISFSASCGLGTCSEHNAIAEMLKSGESEIKTILSIKSDGSIIPSCGRCRELLYQINRNNLNTKVFISSMKTVTLRKLLPHLWQNA